MQTVQWHQQWGDNYRKQHPAGQLITPTIMGGSCCKYHFCHHKTFVMTNMFVMTNIFCHDKSMLKQTSFSFDKSSVTTKDVSAMTNTFVMTKLLSWQEWYLWQLPPMITNSVQTKTKSTLEQDAPPPPTPPHFSSVCKQKQNPGWTRITTHMQTQNNNQADKLLV